MWWGRPLGTFDPWRGYAVRMIDKRRRRAGFFQRDSQGRWRDTRTGHYAATSSVERAIAREKRTGAVKRASKPPTPPATVRQPPRPGARPRKPSPRPAKAAKPVPTPVPPRRPRRPDPIGRTDTTGLDRVKRGPAPFDKRHGPAPDQVQPVKGRRLSHNPGSARFTENATYRAHRGYYFKGTDGRWRTPDGRQVRGQERIVVTDQDGRPVGLAWRSDRAWSYNQRRNLDLLARDTVNLLRRVGVKDVRLGDAREIVRGRPEGVSPRESIAAWADRVASAEGKQRAFGREIALSRTGRRRWRLGGS